MKIITEVAVDKMNPQIEWESGIFMIGSCFADEVGEILKCYGLNCCVNPFGTQYNACSIYNSLKRLCDLLQLNGNKENRNFDATSAPYPFFAQSDVIRRPDGIFATFSHHSRCGSLNRDEFLQKANEQLIESAKRLNEANFLIITLGTSFVYYRDGSVVSNCHKFSANEFEKKYLHTDDCAKVLSNIVEMFPQKQIIFTVSPVRHMGEGAHLNQISKSTLLIAVQRVLNYSNVYYFPSYEIVMDELRDYRWYKEDMSHPTSMAVKYIFEKFKDGCINPLAYSSMEKAFKQHLQLAHRPIGLV